MENLQEKLDDLGLDHFNVIDSDTVSTNVDGEETIFRSDDKLSMTPGSGYAYFGSIGGDWRMIRTIAEDVEFVFGVIKK